MSVAAGLLLYAVMLSWCGPLVLGRIATSGINPLLGVTAWLTAILGVLSAWAAAITALVLAVVDTFSGSVLGAFCLQMLGHVGQIELAGPVAVTVAIALIVVAMATSVLFGGRIVGKLRALRSHSRAHAAAARVIGSPTQWRDRVRRGRRTARRLLRVGTSARHRRHKRCAGGP